MLKRFDEIIKEFLETSSEEITGCALIKADGTIEGAYLPDSLIPMAIIGASALGLAVKVFRELGRGDSVKAVFEGGSGKIILRNIPESDRMLALFSSRESKLGAMLLEVERLINILLEASEER